MDWEARMSLRTWTKQVLAEAEAITRDPEPEPQPAPMGGVGFECWTSSSFPSESAFSVVRFDNPPMS
jgi:hypothetical protein